MYLDAPIYIWGVQCIHTAYLTGGRCAYTMGYAATTETVRGADGQDTVLVLCAARVPEGRVVSRHPFDTEPLKNALGI